MNTIPRASARAIPQVLFVLFAIALPILSGLAWNQASDNPIWPLVRNSLNLCELREAQLSPVSPDGLYRARVVQANCFARFEETLVFVNGVADGWSLETLNPNHAILEIAGSRSLDTITWQDSNASSPTIQLWLVPGALPHQVHRIERSSGPIIIQSSTSTPAPGSERLDD